MVLRIRKMSYLKNKMEFSFIQVTNYVVFQLHCFYINHMNVNLLYCNKKKEFYVFINQVQDNCITKSPSPRLKYL